MKRFCGSAERRARTDDPGSQDVQKQVQMHDQIAFREIVEQLKGKVFSLSYALLGNAPEADVAAQKIFVRLYRTVGAVGLQDKFMKCAYRIAIDQCRVELRLRRLRKLCGWLTGSTPTSEPKGVSAINESRERILVLRALSMLPGRERVLLVLREVADQTVEEIAEIMQLDPATVRRRLFAARQRLRIRVEPS